MIRIDHVTENDENKDIIRRNGRDNRVIAIILDDLLAGWLVGRGFPQWIYLLADKSIWPLNEIQSQNALLIIDLSDCPWTE